MSPVAVMLVGDSMLARFTKRRVHHLEQEIGVDSSPSVLNCAAGGWDSGDVLQRAHYLARIEAPVVVLSIGMNDCAPSKLVTPEAFASNLGAIRKVFSRASIIGFLPPAINEDPSVNVSGRSNLMLDIYRELMRDALGGESCLDVNAQLKSSTFEILESDGIHLSAESYNALIPHLAGLVKAGMPIS